MFKFDVKSNVLKSTLLKHLSNKSSIAVNFTFKKDCILVQSFSSFSFETIILGDYLNLVGETFSFLIDRSCILLENDDKISTITKYDDTVVIRQNSLNINYSIAYDERLERDYSNSELLGTIQSSLISSIVSNHKKLANVSKVLEVGIPSIIVSNNKCFCIYSNTTLFTEIELLPNIEIPYESFNNFNKTLNNCSIEVINSKRDGVLTLKTSDFYLYHLDYKKPNLETVNGILNRVKETPDLGSYDCSSFINLENLFKCFKKLSVFMYLYSDNSIGFSVNTIDNRNIKINCKDDNAKVITLSSVQCDVIYNLFGTLKNINVKYGKDLIVLEDFSKRTLVLSGRTF